MARLFEYQSKNILKKFKIPVPKGIVVKTPEEAKEAAIELDKPVVLKVQVWSKGRAEMGGIKFADTPDEARTKAKKMFDKKIENFPVEKILVEEKLNIKDEMFAGFIIDDSKQKPMMFFSSIGGTGIEETAKKHPDKTARLHADIVKGLKDFQVRDVLLKAGIKGKLLLKLSTIIVRLYNSFTKYDCRSLEVNPLVITEEGKIYAADCHISLDDYGVYRHPDLGIEIAREFDRPPTVLDKIAFKVEENDYRGTFYFLQMTDNPKDGNYIGFHGAGGGGSMMSMDAVANKGFKIANFTDTSGNPPSSKIYRAAKIILSQPGILGYFASGSGVASQEQFHSARGFVKAFLEDNLDIPAVLRLGGNMEELAIDIINEYLSDLNVGIEAYGRDDSPTFCVERLKDLIEKNNYKMHAVKPITEFTPPKNAYSFETITGTIYIDHQKCKDCKDKPCVDACNYNVLKFEEDKPVLNLTREEAKKGRCTECVACEIACRFNGNKGLYIHFPIPGLTESRMPIPGLKEYRDKIIKEDK